MIYHDDAFISECNGSSHVNLGASHYTQEQIKTLLENVPSIFSYDTLFEWESLTKPQKEVFEKINKNQHPSCYMETRKISKIISASLKFANS